MTQSNSMIPIFIGGTGRSGTTILRQTLALHPHIVSIPRELRMIVDPDGAIDLMLALSDRWDPFRADKAVWRFFRMLALAESGNAFLEIMGKVMRGVGVTPLPYARLALRDYFGSDFYDRRKKALFQEIVHFKSRGAWVGSEPWRVPALVLEAGPLEKEAIAAIVSSFFHDLFRNRGKDAPCTHWVEDTPLNLLRYEELRVLFPNMRFIHIFRDPRDVLASYLKQPWGGDSVEAIAKRIAAIMMRWHAFRRDLPEDACLEIRLEDLAEAPESHIQKISDYVKVEMLIDPARIPVRVDRLHAGRWRRELDPEQQTAMKAHMEPVLSVFGFEQ